MITTMQTLEEFVSKRGIKFSVRRVDTRPDRNEWGAGASHWRYTITGKGGQTSGYFSQGSAHTEPPTIEIVLDCLASDSSSTDESFEDWCSEYGYDSDSPQAYATYQACVRTANSLKRVLGAEGFEELLYETERR